MQKSRELWSDLLKGAIVQGQDAPTDSPQTAVIAKCAEHLIKVSVNLAGVHTQLGQTADSERVLREALQAGPFAPSTQGPLHPLLRVLRTLYSSSSCFDCLCDDYRVHRER